ncbi:MAG TPA: DUF2079 domain-containing protein [Polyangiaceae bacterium]|nr:DUF2079 domain-containing protein [Polyangiaceae bacterium]
MITEADFDPTLDAPPESTRGLRALASLALGGASIALGIQFACLRGRLPRFITSNTITSHERSLIVVTGAIGAIVPVLVALVVFAFRRRRALSTVETAADLASPAIVAALLPPLYCIPAWKNAPLTYLAILSVAVLLLRTTLARAFARATELSASSGRWARAFFPFRAFAAGMSRPAVGLAVVSVAGASYAGYTAYLEILNLHRLVMGSYDMGFFDNQMANSLAGHFFRNRIMFGAGPGNSIAGHAHFAHVFFLPLYALHPSSELLIGLQAAFIGAAAVPLYLFASTQVPRAMAVVVALGFLLFAPLHGAQFYDFHWLLCASFGMFWVAYGIAKERARIVVPALLFVLLLREDMSPGIAVLGLFLLLTRARPRIGAALLVTGVVWFGVVKFVIMPAAGNWWFADIYKGFVPPGEKGYGAILKTLVANPGYVFTTLLTEVKLTYVLHLFAPLAFLPWTRPALALLASPAALLTLLTTDYGPAVSIFYQYPGHWVPYLFISSVLGLRVVRESRGIHAARAAAGAAAFGLFTHGLVFGVLFAPTHFQGGSAKVAPSLSTTERIEYENVSALIRLIPPRASVMATEYEVPLLTSHPDCYSAALYDADAEYLLIHRDHFMLEARAHLKTVLGRHEFSLVEKRGHVYLFRQGPTSPESREALGSLGL